MLLVIRFVSMVYLPEDVSLIVPVYNNPNGISQTLRSLAELTQSPMELFIVDNGSTDCTRDIIRDYSDDHNNIHLLIEDEIQGSYAARNKGIKQANGDVLAFLDADEFIDDEWLESAYDELKKKNVGYLGCNIELTLPDTTTLATRYDYHTGFPVKSYIEKQNFAPTCCLFVRREIFEDVGLFDPRLTSGGDKEFGNRVHEAGYTMHFAEDVTVYHPTRNTILELVLKDLRVGRGLCQLQRYHPERYGQPGIPPRPSGAKSPGSTVSLKDRLAFSALGTLLTGMRGIGYYRELIAPSPAPDIDEIPTLD